MKLNIEVEISEKQLMVLKEILSIKIVSDTMSEIPSKTEGCHDQWPDTKGNKDAELLIKKAKASGLSPSELPMLSELRVAVLLSGLESRSSYADILSGYEERIRGLEECLDLKFVEDRAPCKYDRTDLHTALGTHIANVLYRVYGIMTLADLKMATPPLNDIRDGRIRSLGPKSEEKIRNLLNSMYSESPQS